MNVRFIILISMFCFAVVKTSLLNKLLFHISEFNKGNVHSKIEKLFKKSPIQLIKGNTLDLTKYFSQKKELNNRFYLLNFSESEYKSEKPAYLNNLLLDIPPPLKSA